MYHSVVPTAGTKPKELRTGLYVGSVVANNDPLGKNRVTLYIPQILGNAVSNWASPLGLATTGVPQPGTVVHVLFTGGDINFPVYTIGTNIIGGLIIDGGVA